MTHWDPVSAAALCAALLSTAVMPARAADNTAKPAFKVLVEEAAGGFFQAIALGPDGDFYITDYAGKRILRYSEQNGASIHARLDVHPIGMVFDTDGALYFSAQERSLWGGGGTLRSGNLIYRALPGGAPELYMRVADASFLNGWTRLAPGKLLIADSRGGKVWLLETPAGRVSVFLSDRLLTTSDPDEPANWNDVPAANGVKVHDGYIYVSNTARGSFLRARLGEDGKPGRLEEIHTGVVVDDFDFSPRGVLYFATKSAGVNRIVDGRVEEFASLAEVPELRGNASLAWNSRGEGPFVICEGGFTNYQLTRKRPPGPNRLLRFDGKH